MAGAPKTAAAQGGFAKQAADDAAKTAAYEELHSVVRDFPAFPATFARFLLRKGQFLAEPAEIAEQIESSLRFEVAVTGVPCDCPRLARSFVQTLSMTLRP